MNVVSPLAELEAEQFPLIQSCVFPKFVSTSDEVRKASAEAERRLDAHALICRFCLLICFAFSSNWCNMITLFKLCDISIIPYVMYHIGYGCFSSKTEKRLHLDILNSS